MKTQELLTVEFRYQNSLVGHTNKTITIGIFDTLNEAITEGNKVLDILSKKFEVRKDDKFSLNGLYGPNRLVTNTCYPTRGIQYFAKIEKLKFEDLDVELESIFIINDRAIYNNH